MLLMSTTMRSISNETTLKEKDNHIVSVPGKELPKNTQCNNSNNNNKRNHSVNKKFVDNSKSVTILGDTMIKHLSGWKMSKKVNNPGCKIYVKQYAALFKKCAKSLHSSCWH